MVRIRSSPSKMFHEKIDLDIVDTGRKFNLRPVYGETFRKNS